MYFLGFPILFVIIIVQEENYLKVLLTNINKFNDGEQLHLQIRYFMQIVEGRDHDRHSKILLKGYIFLYEDFCIVPQCALKKYIKGRLHIISRA